MHGLLQSTNMKIPYERVGVPEKKRKSLSEEGIKHYQSGWDLNILNVYCISQKEKYKYLNSLTGFFRCLRSHVHAPSVATKGSAVHV